MEKHRCLLCYELFSTQENDFHIKCSKKFFKLDHPPLLNENNFIDRADIKKKYFTPFAATITKKENEYHFSPAKKFTKYYLRFPDHISSNLNENIDLTLHLAEILKLRTVEHSLLRMQSGEYAFVKKHSNVKFNSSINDNSSRHISNCKSVEQLGKYILLYSDYPIHDLISLFEYVLLCYVVGNNGTTLKDFTFHITEDNEKLFPLIDNLFSTKLMNAGSNEFTFSLNDKYLDFTRKDFDSLTDLFNINRVSVERIYKRFVSSVDTMLEFIDKSFLSVRQKYEYKKLVYEHAGMLE